MWLRVWPRLCIELYCYIKLELGLTAGIRGASGRVSGRMSAGSLLGVSWVLLDGPGRLLGCPCVSPGCLLGDPGGSCGDLGRVISYSL